MYIGSVGQKQITCFILLLKVCKLYKISFTKSQKQVETNYLMTHLERRKLCVGILVQLLFFLFLKHRRAVSN